MLTSTADQPSIPPPPTFADFKFSVIGQPPQLLKRMGATPPLEFRHSPTPMHLDLQYPSRAGTPWTSAVTSQPSLQQRLESTNYHTDSISDGHHLSMDVSEHPTERKPIIDSEQPIRSPFQSLDDPTSLSKQTSCHSPPQSYESQAPQPSLSNTQNIAIRCSPIPTISSSSFQNGSSLGPISSSGASETHQSSKPQQIQIHFDAKLLYESAFIAFEKAERGLKSAQETYDAAKATLTAIVTRFPQALTADACQRYTSKIVASKSSTSATLGDSVDPGVTEVFRDVIGLQYGPKQPIQQLDYPTFPAEQRAIGRRITELEQEADDVQLAWRSLSAQRCSIQSSTFGANEYPHSATPSQTQSSPGTSESSSPMTQSASSNLLADSTIIVKDEDIMNDHRRPHISKRVTSFHNPSSGIPRLIDSVSMDHEVGRRSPLAPVSDQSGLVEDVQPIQATIYVSPTAAQGTTMIVDSSRSHAKGTQEISLALRGSLHNSIELDDTEDDDPVNSDHARSESIPISLGEEISNELEVARELEREDSGPCSSSVSQDVSRSSSIHPIDRLHDTVDEEVQQTRPSELSSESKEEQDIDRNSSTVQAPTSETYRNLALLSSSGEHRSINENSLLQRLEPLVSTASLSNTPEPQPELMTGPPSSAPSILGKRQHYDPPSPRSQPSVVFPSKRRHFTNTEHIDPPSLESRISEASSHINETIQSNSTTSTIHYRAGHTNYGKNSYVPRNKYIPAAERSMSPPSGPRAIRQDSNSGPAASSRPFPANSRPPKSGVGSDFYPNKYKSKGPRKKYVHDGSISTSVYDRPSGTGRGAIRQNRVPIARNWDSGSTTDSPGLRRPDVRTHPSQSERRGVEQISLADRLRDP
ncbi:hypothetical protein C0993_012641 [Termitomyces sp. T159_Od127]|nr:hypothetical protein C0993_012641 [Termitomyces sp. T159_Od127]